MDDIRHFARNQLQSLIAMMREDSLRVIGPQWCDGAIVFVDLEHADQLPRGYHDKQAPRHYRGQLATTPAISPGPMGRKHSNPFSSRRANRFGARRKRPTTD